MPPFGVGPLIVDRPSGASTFAPSDEPGMLAWWNSENANLDGGNNVISYVDISGNGIAATAASAPQRPTTTFADPDYGGHASSGWSNVADTLVVSDILSIGAYTLVQVCKIPSSVAAYLMAFSAGDYVYGNTSFSMYSGARIGGAGSSGYNADAGAGWFDSSVPVVFVRRMDGTHVGDTMRINDVLVPMTEASFLLDPGTGAFNTLFAMMSYATGGAAVDGSWGTSLIYDHAVSDDVATKLTNYFRSLYSI